MKLLLFVIGVALLLVIFVRRYQITEKGFAAGQIFSKRKRVFSQLFHHITEEKHEITAQEMIPSPGSINPKNAVKGRTMFKRAEAFLGKGDLNDTEKLLIQSLSLDPSNLEAYNKLGLIYLKQNQYKKAEMLFRKLVSAKSDEASYHSNLGLTLYHQQQLPEAKSCYEKAIELDHGRAGRYFSLGKILHEMNETDKALVHFQKALDMDPKNLDYLLTLAQFYQEQGTTTEAKHILGEVLAMFPDNEDAVKMLKDLP